MPNAPRVETTIRSTMPDTDASPASAEATATTKFLAPEPLTEEFVEIRLVDTLVIDLSLVPDTIELSDISEDEVEVIVLSDTLDTVELVDSNVPLPIIVLSPMPSTSLAPDCIEPNTTDLPAAPVPETDEFPDASETVDVISRSPVPVNDDVMPNAPAVETTVRVPVAVTDELFDTMPADASSSRST